MTGRTSGDVVRPSETAFNVNHRFRELLGRYGQAPDPPRDSDVPSRPSMRQVAFYLLPGGGYWEEPRMGAKLAQPPHVAWQPRGQLLADDNRDNLARPASAPVADTIDTWAGGAAFAESVPGGGDW